MLTIDEMCNGYSLAELKKMCENIFGIPCRKTKRVDIARAIHGYYEDAKRTADLFKHL